MVTVEPELSNSLIQKLRNNTLCKLGYDSTKAMNPEIEKMLNEAIIEAENTLSPKGIYHILPVLATNSDGIHTEAGIIKSTLFRRLVEMCKGERLIVFMVTTLGEELDIAYESEESLPRQLILHTIGAELIELVTDEVEMDWKTRVVKPQGLQCSWRFSPGYCDWDLEGQGVIFEALDPGLIGVQLTSHFVMRPSKSISAISIIAKEVPFPAPCAFCGKRNCPWRRLPRRKHKSLVS